MSVIDLREIKDAPEGTMAAEVIPKGHTGGHYGGGRDDCAHMAAGVIPKGHTGGHYGGGQGGCAADGGTGGCAAEGGAVIDVPMRQIRDLSTVTAEIRAYQEATRRMVIGYSIEIGRRLVEAKSMVRHGEWGDYLREELGFSQSTANTHMQMFREYGADQMSLDGAVLKNQAFGNLSYTQALALLALPSEAEREQFVAEHDMEELSTRALKDEINRIKADAERESRAAEERARVAETSMDAAIVAKNAAEIRAKEAAEQAEQALAKAEEARTAAEEQLKLLEAQANARLAKELEAKSEADKLRDQLAKAKAAKDKAQAELKQLREHPELPAELVEQHRRAAEAAARQAAQDQAEAKVREAEKKLVDAEQAAAAARAQVQAAEKQAADLRKKLDMASPEISVIRADFGRIQEELMGLIRRARALDGEAGAKVCRALAALLEQATKEVAG